MRLVNAHGGSPLVVGGGMRKRSQGLKGVFKPFLWSTFTGSKVGSEGGFGAVGGAVGALGLRIHDRGPITPRNYTYTARNRSSEAVFS